MPFKAFKLMQVGQAYIDAVMKGGLERILSTCPRNIRNHGPGGSIVERLYWRTTKVAICVVYLIFLLTAVLKRFTQGHGCSGMGSQVAAMMYDEMVDALYQGTEFEKDGEQ
jgi:hypothetical protein